LGEPLTSAALARRLDEEVGRAERHGTMLSCLLVIVENLDEIAYEHGRELPERAVSYVASTLGTELRRFDRIGRPGAGELAIVLPGADSPSGELVARRVLERVRAIKIESRGARRPLELSVGLAAWRADMSGQELLARARAAAARRNGEDPRPPGGAHGEGAAGPGERRDPEESHGEDTMPPGHSSAPPPIGRTTRS
jgi:diguanylate cyclase (GGDEF)-like protein